MKDIRHVLLDGSALERSISNNAKRFLGARNAPLDDSSTGGSQCWMAVLASAQAYIDAPPYVFRSSSTAQPPSKFTTAATAGFFT
jgi:hypothetical protein